MQTLFAKNAIWTLVSVMVTSLAISQWATVSVAQEQAGPPVQQNAPESISEAVNDNTLEVLSDLACRVFSDIAVRLLSGNSTELLSGNEPNLLSENEAKLMSEKLDIPTIGIGAGGGCDGQVLVTHDLLGLFDRFTPKFVKKYAHLHKEMAAAISSYKIDVEGGTFPSEEHSFDMTEEDYDALMKAIG